MEEKIKKYVEHVFADVPMTTRAKEIQEEILQNLLDKYADLRAEGKSEEDAYAVAISAGGDLSGIVADLKGEPVAYNYNYEKQFDKLYEKQYKKEKKKCRQLESWLWPLVICAYILISFLFHWWKFSWLLFLCGSVVEETYRFLVLKSHPKARKSALNSVIWISTTILYFVLSFGSGRWDISWILFVLAIPVSRLIRLRIFPDPEEEDDDEEDKQEN